MSSMEHSKVEARSADERATRDDSADDIRPYETAVEPEVNYLTNDYGWKSWLFTLDHKRIGLMYLVTISITFFLGGLAAAGIRGNLVSPQGLLGAETYNKIFTSHGVIMVFFFLIPSIPAVLGNFLVPMMIGAKDVAFPKLNLLSWYLFVAGVLMALIALMRGSVATGWTFYAPLSSTYTDSTVVWVIVGAFLAGFSSILTG
jgi:cytochrome c oxidase subunit 1